MAIGANKSYEQVAHLAKALCVYLSYSKGFSYICYWKYLVHVQGAKRSVLSTGFFQALVSHHNGGKPEETTKSICGCHCRCQY